MNISVGGLGFYFGGELLAAISAGTGHVALVHRLVCLAELLCASSQALGLVATDEHGPLVGVGLGEDLPGDPQDDDTEAAGGFLH